MSLLRLILLNFLGSIQPNQKRKVAVEPSASDLFIFRSDVETDYSLDLIAAILEHKGPSYLCDEIARDEDTAYVKLPLEYLILGHVAPEALSGKRLLDFGCGSGSSTIHLAKMFPDTEIIGVELCAKSLEIANLKAKHHQLNNVRFLLSPSGDELPENIGEFDFILLSAVYEHLLPDERPTVLAQLWSRLSPEGIIFFNETPHRYFPIETHTTQLPGINYLPDSLALFCARRFSSRVAADETWESLLRKGIRGGTEKEIVELIRTTCQEKPMILEPKRLGMKDRIDLKYADFPHLSWKRKLLKVLLRTMKFCSGYAYGSLVVMAIQKPVKREQQ